MRKLSVAGIALVLCFLTANTIYGNFDRRPWSEITYSSNEKYVFVLISSGSLENYAKRVRESWESLKLSPEELKDYETNLAGALNEEKQIRSLYLGSGLYLKENPKEPLWKVSTEDNEKWLTKFNTVSIADDGSYVIGFNYHVGLLANIPPDDKPDKEEIGLFIYSSNKNLRSYKVSELVKQKDLFAKSGEGFYWARKELIFDNEHKTFTLIKENDDKLEFNIFDGEVLSKAKKENHSACFGFIMIFGLVIISETVKAHVRALKED